MDEQIEVSSVAALRVAPSGDCFLNVDRFEDIYVNKHVGTEWVETSIPGAFVEADIDASERRIVAGAVDGTRVFDLVDGEWRPTAIEPSNFPRVRISPNGERVAVVGELPGGGRRALLLYNLRNGTWVEEGNFPSDTLRRSALSMDGTASRVFTSDPQSAQEGTRSGRGFVHTRQASGVWR